MDSPYFMTFMKLKLTPKLSGKMRGTSEGKIGFVFRQGLNGKQCVRLRDLLSQKAGTKYHKERWEHSTGWVPVQPQPLQHSWHREGLDKVTGATLAF